MRNDKTQLDDWSMYTAKSKWAKVRKKVKFTFIYISKVKLNEF